MNTFINGAPVWSDEQMNELRQQLAERDAEVATLEIRLEEKTAECQSFYEEAERVIKQRDDLRQQVTLLREELNTIYNLVPDLVVLMEPSALTFTEPK